MSVLEIGGAIALVLVAGIIFNYQDRYSRKIRAITGAILFVLGWIGIFSALVLPNMPFMQNEKLVYAWIGTAAGAIVLGLVFVVNAVSTALEDRVRLRKRR